MTAPSADTLERDVPPIQDLKTLSRNICTAECTIEAWVRQGMFPAPKMRGGKRYWRWSDVEKWWDGDESSNVATNIGGIREATRRVSHGR